MIESVVKPKYFVPIGGTVTKMRAYKNMIGELGFDKKSVFELLQGESVVFEKHLAKKGDKIHIEEVYIEGGNSESVSPIVIKDRQVLSEDGVFVVVVPVSRDEKKLAGKVEMISRGFVYVKESRALMGRSRDVVNKALDKYQGDLSDWGKVRADVEKSVEKFLFRETRGKPLIIVSSIII